MNRLNRTVDSRHRLFGLSIQDDSETSSVIYGVLQGSPIFQVYMANLSSAVRADIVMYPAYVDICDTDIGNTRMASEFIKS